MPVKYYLSSRPDRNGDVPVRVAINIKGVGQNSTLGYNVPPDKWDANAQMMKKNSMTARRIPASMVNARIKSIDAHMLQYELSLTSKPTKEELAHQLSLAIGDSTRTIRCAVADTDDKGQQGMAVLECLQSFLSHSGKNLKDTRAHAWSESTYGQWISQSHRIKSFLEHIGQRSLSISSMNADVLASYVNYLRTECGLKEETVEKQYSRMKQFLRWCVEAGYCTDEVLQQSRQTFDTEITKEVYSLEYEEFLRLYSYEVPANGTVVTLKKASGEKYEKTVKNSSALAKARDLFCFCASTSLRYSDMAKLKRSDIVGDKIKVVIKKTGKSVEIDLNKFSKAILEKYGGVEYPDGLAFPVISNQKMNDYLKELGELCEINEPCTRRFCKGGVEQTVIVPKYKQIGTHTARRTFVTLALTLGISPETIMSWTGHKDYEQLRKYVRIVEEKKRKDMDKFNNIE